MSVRNFAKQMINELKWWILGSIITLACVSICAMTAGLLMAIKQWGYCVGMIFVTAAFAVIMIGVIVNIVDIFKRYNRDFLVIKTRE